MVRLKLIMGKLFSVVLLVMALSQSTYAQKVYEVVDSVKTESQSGFKSSFHINGSGPFLASGLPIYINGRETTDRAALNPKLIKSAKVLRPGDPKLVIYGPRGANGVLLIESESDSIRLDKPFKPE